MSRKSSTGSHNISGMQPGNEGTSEESGRPLRHEESLVTRALRSIDPDWLAAHKDLLDDLAKPLPAVEVKCTQQRLHLTFPVVHSHTERDL